MRKLIRQVAPLCVLTLAGCCGGANSSAPPPATRSVAATTRSSTLAVKHLLSFPNREKYGTDGDGAEYVLDGKSIGFGGTGFHNLLAAIETFEPGSTLFDTMPLRGVFTRAGPPPYFFHDAYANERQELLRKLKSRKVNFELIIETGQPRIIPYSELPRG